VTTAHAARRVVTCDAERGTPADRLGVIEDGAVIIEGDRVTWVGRRREVPEGVPVTDHGDVVLTPGLVDAHTHACWAGSRHAEYAVRMAGGDYEAIAQAGGGIVSTHRAVASMDVDELTRSLASRLARMATLGVTTVEVKSGYGLEPDAEMKQLTAIGRAANDASLPNVVPTYLALHALPPSARSDRKGFVRRIAETLVPHVATQGLARFVDAYVDRDAFQVAEARLVFEAARRAGLGVRVHVGQFADIGGAELAAELGAASVDHLEHVSVAGIARLVAARTRVVLLPTASFTLAQAPPPVALLRDAGVEMVVASDANPGTAPTESLPLALAFAVRAYGLTPEEALLGATRHAAASLEIPGATARARRGALLAGSAADFVVWDLPHELAIVQPWGVSRTRLVVRDGRVLHTAPRVDAR
jgi:imidazolonepropionase